jgi:hypothetical protein
MHRCLQNIPSYIELKAYNYFYLIYNFYKFGAISGTFIYLFILYFPYYSFHPGGLLVIILS